MRYYLDPFGCVKNQVDAEVMMETLDRSGWESAEGAASADLIIINSCGFIESAKQESINAALAYRKEYPGKRILLAGCLAQRYGAELAASLEEADFFFGNADLSQIAAAASSAMAGDGRLLLPQLPLEKAGPSGGLCISGGRPILSLPGSAYIKIAEGCNNHCAFCAIPGIRGPLRSRPVADILEECRRLLDRGRRELCLIGQDLGSYGSGSRDGQNGGLLELLEAISRLEGQFWVRLLYIHPDNFPLPILDLCREDGRLLPYFDIPIQHGSAAILGAMNRRGTAETYLSLIERIRSALPDAVIRSTFMTGFPGETDRDFQDLLDFQAAARLDWAGFFAYSREEDTPAYVMKGRVSKKIALERKKTAEERQIPITEERMDRFVGRTMEALVEEAVAPDEGLYLGRLFCQAPEVDGSAVIHSAGELALGTFVRGHVAARAGIDLEVRVKP